MTSAVGELSGGAGSPDENLPGDRDRRAFIAQNLQLLPVPGLDGIRLYTAHARSGLGRLTGVGLGKPPYWAYPWAGGLVLARHVLQHPQLVAGSRIVDLGAGSGLVGIAALRAGAAHATAIDTDPYAAACVGLNAEANAVALEIRCADILDGDPPDADLILAGDVFYDAEVAARMLPFLRRCRQAGIAVLIGDPGRTPLPLARLSQVASYDVADFGTGGGGSTPASGVFELRDEAS